MVASERDIANRTDSRRTIIIVVALIAAVLIGAVFYLLMRVGRGGSNVPPRLEGAIRPGAPEWEKSVNLIALDDPEADESGRALGDIVMTLHTTVRNFTGKTITGLEIRAAVVDHQGQPVKQRFVVVLPVGLPVPRPQLEPNRTMPVNVVLDGMTEKDDRANIKMEVTGFKFQ